MKIINIKREIIQLLFITALCISLVIGILR